MYSPKPNIPPPKAYDPPSPPSAKDLGPPPPGYGRYADFERGLGGGPTTGGTGAALVGPPRRNLDEVLCFKVRNDHHIIGDLCLLCIFFSAVKRVIMPIIAGIAMYLVIVEVANESKDTGNNNQSLRTSFTQSHTVNHRNVCIQINSGFEHNYKWCNFL